jgi:hypothetical protein
MSPLLWGTIRGSTRCHENIYAKIGVFTRAGAAMYAMEYRFLE